MSEYVHQGKEIYLATVLAGDGVQVPLRIYHAVCYRPLLLELSPSRT